MFLHLEIEMQLRHSPITVFTPSFADQDNTNAQNLTVKEIVARLPPQLFRVIMISAGFPDMRIAGRPNTELVRWSRHGNTARLISRLLVSKPDIYFFPRYGLLDHTFFRLQKHLHLRTALISYVVMMITESESKIVRRSILQADRLCANSEYIAQSIAQWFGVNADIIYDGVNRRFFFPPDNSCEIAAARQLSVLYAGSFQSRKRVELVIKQAIRRPDIQFRLAGQGETQVRCRALCQEHGCKNVVFLGHLSPDRLGGEMRNADIFLFPSIREGNPQVLLQAAACGLPVIAMNHYRPSYVVDGETGFLVGTDHELAARFNLLVSSRELRQAMSQTAVRHARGFDWDRIAEQWAEVFLGVVEQRQKIGCPRQGA